MTQAEIYAYYKNRHRCVRCHKQDAYTLSGRSYCAECCEKERLRGKLRYPADKGRRSRRAATLKAERLENGLCPECGGPQDKPGRQMCESCAARKRERRRVKREAAGCETLTSMRERSYDGFCYHCGKPVKVGVTFAHEPFRVCEQCYQNTVAAAAKGRAAMRAKYTVIQDWTGGRYHFWIVTKNGTE